jgi:hypothetical protein
MSDSSVGRRCTLSHLLMNFNKIPRRGKEDCRSSQISQGTIGSLLSLSAEEVSEFSRLVLG